MWNILLTNTKCPQFSGKFSHGSELFSCLPMTSDVQCCMLTSDDVQRQLKWPIRWVTNIRIFDIGFKSSMVQEVTIKRKRFWNSKCWTLLIYHLANPNLHLRKPPKITCEKVCTLSPTSRPAVLQY